MFLIQMGMFQVLLRIVLTVDAQYFVEICSTLSIIFVIKAYWILLKAVSASSDVTMLFLSPTLRKSEWQRSVKLLTTNASGDVGKGSLIYCC